MTSTDRTIGLNEDAKLMVVLIDSCLLEVRMALDLIDDRLDFASCNKIEKHWNGAVAHSNTPGQALLNEAFHFLPDFMVRWSQDLNRLGIPVNIRAHPVDQVKIDIVKLELFETCSESFLWITLVIVPQFGCDPEILSLDSCCETFLESLPNCGFITIKSCSVNVTVAVLQDSVLDLLFAVIVQESSKPQDRDFCSVVQSECWTFNWGYLL